MMALRGIRSRYAGPVSSRHQVCERHSCICMNRDAVEAKAVAYALYIRRDEIKADVAPGELSSMF